MVNRCNKNLIVLLFATLQLTFCFPTNNTGDEKDNTVEAFGAKRILNLKDHDVVNDLNSVVKFGVESLNKVANDNFYFSLVRLKEASSQELLGTIYELILYLGSTDCLKTEVR